MAGIKIKAEAGTGSTELQGPANTNNNTTLKLPSADGSANQLLKTDGSGNLGWATDQAGKILQVVKGAQMSETQLSSTSTTLADTGTTVTITPSSASSKIWVIASGDTFVKGTGYNAYGRLALLRGSTILHEVMQGYDSGNSSFGARLYNPFCMQVVDEPNTTSATTYKVQYGLKYSTSYSATIYYPSRDETEMYAAQQITVMEVAA